VGCGYPGTALAVLAAIALTGPQNAQANDLSVGVDVFVGPQCITGTHDTGVKDRWSTSGDHAGLRVALRLHTYVRITADVSHGTYKGDRDFNRTMNIYAVEAMLPVVFAELRTGPTVFLSSGEPPPATKTSGTHPSGIGWRLGLDIPLGAIRLGVEAHTQLPPSMLGSISRVHAVVGLHWSPGTTKRKSPLQ